MRTKKFILNTVFELIPYILIALFGMIKFNVIIKYLGDDLNGYYQTINNVLSYFFVYQTGIIGATTYKLYKPFVEEDNEKIWSICKSSRKLFIKIAKIISLLLIIAAVFLFFSNIEETNKLDVIGGFLLIGFSYTITYFFYGSIVGALFTANLSKYKYSVIFNGLRLLGDIFIVCIILKGQGSLISIGLIVLGIKIIEEIILYNYGKKYFKDIFNTITEKEEKGISKITKDLVFGNIASLVNVSTDNLLLAIFVSQTMVSIYSAYYFIVRFLLEITNKGSIFLGDAFGNIFVSRDKNRALNIFNEYLYGMVFIGFSIALTFSLIIRGFIPAWVDSNISYIVNDFTIYMYSLYIFLSIIYLPLLSVIKAKGLFKEQKIIYVKSAVINLILSIILVKFVNINWAISSLLFATNISIVWTIYKRLKLIDKFVFPELKINKIIIFYIINIILFSLIILFTNPIAKFIMINVTGLFSLILIATISFVIISLISLGLLLIINPKVKETLYRIKHLKRG
ncbi:MAG: lipopolysaccharide biosynthesis protein [Bacilli bacterium]